MNLTLAQYSIRSKQAYIFRTNRMQEITGASAIISDAFKELVRCIQENGIHYESVSADQEFRMVETLDRFSSGALDAEELFTGGGNTVILFKNRDIFINANKLFSRMVIEDYPGMIPMAVGIEITDDNGLFDYRKDWNRLMEEAERVKNTMHAGRIHSALPYSMVDRVTFQPFSTEMKVQGVDTRLSAESAAKRKKYRDINEKQSDVALLDELVTEKGRESILAVVHIDGNNMGNKLMRKLGDNSDYDSCVNIMRSFTKDVDHVFKNIGRNAVDECSMTMKKNGHPKTKVRWIVNDGDDATFVCNGRYAKEYTVAYLRAVNSYAGKSGRYSSCAGICLFHSHYPFARAYDLAEQACENAKVPVHRALREGRSSESCWLDFHYIHGGINGDLDSIRERFGITETICRPWFVSGDKDGGVSDRQINKVYKLLKDSGITRGNIKTLGATLEASATAGQFEWDKICRNHPGVKEKLLEIVNEKELFKILYDLSEIMDLWYVGE